MYKRLKSMFIIQILTSGHVFKPFLAFLSENDKNCSESCLVGLVCLGTYKKIFQLYKFGLSACLHSTDRFAQMFMMFCLEPFLKATRAYRGNESIYIMHIC